MQCPDCCVGRGFDFPPSSLQHEAASTPSYLVLDLCNATGGQTVLPRGSDGVVDYDSMAANVPPADVGANVFTVDSNYDIPTPPRSWCSVRALMKPFPPSSRNMRSLPSTSLGQFHAQRRPTVGD